MSNISLLTALSLGTLVLVLGWALWQFARVRESQKKRGEHPGGIAGPE